MPVRLCHGRVDVMVRPRSVLSEHGRDLMDQVVAAARATTTAETALHDAVGRARQAGIAWATIGAAMRVSRQAAQKRFSRPAPGRLI